MISHHDLLGIANELASGLGDERWSASTFGHEVDIIRSEGKVL